MRLLAVAWGMLLFGCATLPKQPVSQVQPDMDGVLRVIGRFSTAHACPYGDGQYALTAAHVVDPRPFDPMVSLFPARWSDGDGHSGTLEPVTAFGSSDLAVVQRRDGKPFARAYPLAREAPFAGERVFILAYDSSSVSAALSPHLVEGKVIRVVADNLILDENSKPGSSGGCVLNERGEIVGIVAWGRKMEDEGIIGISVGVWSSTEDWQKLEALLAKEKEAHEP